jgi:hypothetical protein
VETVREHVAVRAATEAQGLDNTLRKLCRLILQLVTLSFAQQVQAAVLKVAAEHAASQVLHYVVMLQWPHVQQVELAAAVFVTEWAV